MFSLVLINYKAFVSEFREYLCDFDTTCIVMATTGLHLNYNIFSCTVGKELIPRTYDKLEVLFYVVYYKIPLYRKYTVISRDIICHDPLCTTSNEDKILQNFLVILKSVLHTIMLSEGSNLQPHTGVLTVARRLFPMAQDSGYRSKVIDDIIVLSLHDEDMSSS